MTMALVNCLPARMMTAMACAMPMKFTDAQMTTPAILQVRPLKILVAFTPSKDSIVRVFAWRMRTMMAFVTGTKLPAALTQPR